MMMLGAIGRTTGRGPRAWAAALLVGAMAAAGLAVVAAPGTAQAVVDDQNPASSWRPSGGIAYAQARVGDMIVLGCTFTAMRSPSGQTVTRNRLAAVSATTGELLPWNPAPTGSDIRTVAASPDGATVYVGGTFTAVGGATRSNFAALSASTGKATSFVANANATVRQARFVDGRLFVVGSFWKMNGSNRGNGAEVDPLTGGVKPWDPKVTSGLITVAGAPDGIYIGGYFSSIGGVNREHVAKVDRTSGALQPWISGSTCQDSTNQCDVWDILWTPDAVFLAQGGPGGRIVSLDPVTGVQRWWTGSDGDFTSVIRDGDKLYAAGHFEDAVAGVPRAGLVTLDARTGAVLPDLTTPVVGGSGVWQVMLDNGVLRACGQFSTVGTAAIGKYVSFPVLPDPPDLQPPAAPGSFRVPSALADQVTLTWAGAADDVATIQYRIWRNGVQIGTASGTLFKDRTVTPGTSFTYTVEAVDGAGNVSPQAKPVTVTTEPARSVLLARGAAWRYLSMGTDPGANWQNAAFADSSWATGNGEFGFGDGDEDSPISPKGVAHYFRTTFSVDDVATVDTATLRMLVDDGAVAYLNGTEIARSNMPAGTPTKDTVASTGLSGSAELTYQSVAIPVAALKNGTNTLAVEVHNSSATSSDISFDAFVTATRKAAPQAPVAPGAITAVPGADRVDLQWPSVGGADSYEVTRDGAVVGTPGTSSFTDTGLTASTQYTYRVRARNQVGVSPDSNPATVTTLAAPPAAPATPTGLVVGSPTASSLTLTWDAVTGADRYVVRRDGVALPATTAPSLVDTGLSAQTAYSYTVTARNAGGDSPASDPVMATTSAAPITQYVSAGSTYRYLDAGAVAPASWATGAFDDTAWKAGKAQLGYGDGDENTVIGFGPSSTSKAVTYYFRTTFDAGASVSDVTGVALRGIIDDGAVVYLNGQEVWRYNLPTGSITATTRATTAIAGADESTWRSVTLPAAALKPGQNVVAVEVHQDSSASSDVSFDLELKPVR